MQRISKQYLDSLDYILPREPSFKTPVMVSSVTGFHVTPKRLREPGYWVDNMVSPVQFSQAISKVITSTKQNVAKKIDMSHRETVIVNALVEVGPHSALLGPIKETIASIDADSKIKIYSILKRFKPAINTLMETCGDLICAGSSIDLQSINEVGDTQVPRVLHTLPAYEFNHSRSYWYESEEFSENHSRKTGRHDLLGLPMTGSHASEAR